jgi:hypothetical protein
VQFNASAVRFNHVKQPSTNSSLKEPANFLNSIKEPGSRLKNITFSTSTNAAVDSYFLTTFSSMTDEKGLIQLIDFATAQSNNTSSLRLDIANQCYLHALDNNGHATRRELYECVIGFLEDHGYHLRVSNATIELVNYAKNKSMVFEYE